MIQPLWSNHLKGCDANSTVDDSKEEPIIVDGAESEEDETACNLLRFSQSRSDSVRPKTVRGPISSLSLHPLCGLWPAMQPPKPSLLKE